MLISQNSDLINLINQSIKNDLNSRNPVHVRYFKTATYVNLISKILHKHRYELFIKTCTNIVSVLLSSVLQTSVQKIWLKHLLAKYQSSLSQGKFLRSTYYVKSLQRSCLIINVLWLLNRDTLDVVKQSAALCLLRLFRTEPNVIPGGEWTTRIIHLLNDQVGMLVLFNIYQYNI